MCIFSSQPFEELTLWKFFDCLVDGIACLEYGLEFGIIASTGDVTIRRQTGFQSRVHFDLKAENSKYLHSKLFDEEIC